MTKLAGFDWKKYLTICLQSTNYCCLTTVDSQSGVWANPVYFAWDPQFNFYFISQMHSRHMQNITNSPIVALAIYNTAQKGDVTGIQLEGTAEIYNDSSKDKDQIKEAFKIYHGRTGGGGDVQHYIKDPSWIFVKVVPTQIYYFNTKIFDEERQTVPMALLK